MAWAKPEYSKREVNRAGEALVSLDSSSESLPHALTVINNWRASHSFPLNTFQKRLREQAKQVDSNSLVVQRIKRLSSIKSKLERIKGLNLAQIQDIGGCRAIVRNITAVDELVRIYTKSSRGVKHNLFSFDDYIQDKPKPDGYRSVHFVYQYKSDKNGIYDNLKIEIQIRTLLQHAWATAVETIDTFTGQSLKAGSGLPRWKRFFALTSSLIALKEGRPAIPDTSSNYHDLRIEIIRLEKALGVISSLEAYTATLQQADVLPYGKMGYYLLQLDPVLGRTTIRAFRSKDSTAASRAYIDLEKRNMGGRQNVVLVSAESLDALKLAYPNYYADTGRFIDILREIISDDPQLKLFNDSFFY